jgi:hypothetical protein
MCVLVCRILVREKRGREGDKREEGKEGKEIKEGKGRR